ncbi:uncharacterized protein LOC132554600 [Ylistrum balloti]|uniref:uncharacterized protein LOC132554600 n=1 Tax=Ylistrum balloti TaxID=509963 RepID=UPI00290581D1|nr:uncharacterized protein LOC132554600 [Ylistrum balloti]
MESDEYEENTRGRALGKRFSIHSCLVYDEMRRFGQLCDAVIKVEHREFPIHRAIMSACSPYFRALFTNSFDSVEKREVYIPGVSADIMQIIIDYAYTRHARIDETNVERLLPAADRLLVHGLVTGCCDFLAGELEAENCIGIYNFARAYFCHKLVKSAYRFLMHNFSNVLATNSEYYDLSVEEVCEILSSDDLNVKNEEMTFTALLRWIDHDPENRKCHIATLLRTVRLGLLSTQFFVEKVKSHPYVKENAECKPLVIETLKCLYALDMNEEKDLDITNPLTLPRVPHEVMFVVGGWSGGAPTNIMETYDTRADKWIMCDSTDEVPRAYHGTVTIDLKIYVIGGFDGTQYFNNVRCFDPVSKLWSEAAPMNSKRCYVSTAVLGVYIYAMGGYDGHVRLNTAEQYFPGRNQWSLIAPMNHQRSDASATTLHDKIYICGGSNGQECLNSAECYDPKTNQWTMITPMRNRRSGVGVIAYGDQIYALGGFNGIARMNTAERYNPTTARWQTIPEMFDPRTNFGVEVIDDMIFTIGGFNAVTSISNVECFDKSSEQWFDATEMNVDRSGLSACIVNGLPNVQDYTYKVTKPKESKQKESVMKTNRTKGTKERGKNKETYANCVDWEGKRPRTKRISRVGARGRSDGLKKGDRKVKAVAKGEECSDITDEVIHYTCDLCQRVFDSSLGLNRHIRAHKSKQYKCDTCGKVFRRQSSLRKHGVLHSDDSPYKCLTCGKTSKSKERFTLHLRTHSGVKPYQCDICGRNFTQIGNLRLHKKNVHAPESIFKCDICLIEFEQNRDLISHVLTHNDGKILKCFECGKMFGTKEHFEKHKDLHKETRPFNCDICGNTYKKNSDLKCHLETHNTAQGYVCDVCGRGFSYKSSLKYHQRIHTGVKPYTCDICGKAFRTSSNRSKHMLSHTNYKPFSCDQCPKVFRDNRALVIHKRTHSGNRPYQCSQCFKTFIVQSELNRHRKNVHQNAVERGQVNGRAADKTLSKSSKDTLYEQRDSTTCDSVRDNTIKDRIAGDNTGVQSSVDLQQCVRDDSAVILPGIPVISSSHVPISSYLDRDNVQRTDRNILGECGISNICQYEVLPNNASANVYGYVKDTFVADNKGSCEKDPVSFPYQSSNQADTTSGWINDFESNLRSDVNISLHPVRYLANNQHEEQFGENENRQEMPVSHGVQYDRDKTIEQAMNFGSVSTCDSTRQPGVPLQYSETPVTPITKRSPQKENERTLDSKSKAQPEDSPRHESNCSADMSVGDQILNRGDLSMYRCGSVPESSARDVCDARPARDSSLGRGSQDISAELETEPRVISGSEGRTGSCDRDNSPRGAIYSVGGRKEYNMNEDTDMENRDSDCENEATLDPTENGNDNQLDKQSIKWREGGTENRHTSPDAVLCDGNSCQKVDKFVKILEKYPKNRCTDSITPKFANGKRKQKTSLNSRIYACRYCGKSYSSIKALNSHEKVHKEGPNLSDSQVPGEVVNNKRTSLLNTNQIKLKSKKRGEILCTICNKQLPSQKNLQRHMVSKHPSGLSNTEFSCGTCGKIYPSKLSLQVHVRMHNATEHACPVCNKLFHRPAYLRRHMVIHTDENPYRCPYCSKDFTSQNLLKPHIRTHTGNKPFQCDVCGMRFTQQAQLTSHKKQHAPDKAFKCDDCGMEFMDNQELLSHITAHGREAHKCVVCGKVFGRMEHFEKHMDIHNRDRRTHKCMYCDSTFLNKNDCRIHETIHTNDKAFSCEYCGKQFRHKSGLKYHIRTHTGEKPYTCKICGKTFRTNSYLHKHTMFHTGYRPYRCVKCGKGFTCKNDLTAHTRTHTGEKPFACLICKKTFKERATLKKHLVNVHTCSICGHTYRNRSDLGIHVLSHQTSNTASQYVS